MRRRLLALGFLSTMGCADGTPGTLVVRASGEAEAQTGVPAERMVDGFSARFDHAVISLEGIYVRTRLMEDAEVEVDPVLVELVPDGHDVWRFEGVGAGRWDDVGFVLAPPPADVRLIGGVEPRIRDAMVEGRWSSYYEGALFDPAGNEYPFAIGIPVRAEYLSCRSGTDRTRGIAIPEAGVAQAEITWHLTHLFFDSFAENSALRGEPFAAAWDGVRPIDLEALRTQSLANLRGVDGAPLRDENGFPVLYIPPAEGAETLADFVMAARFGHFNGLEGECTTEILPGGQR